MSDLRESERKLYLDTLRGLQTLIEMQQTVIAEAIENLSGRSKSVAGKKRSPRRRRSKGTKP